LNRVVTDLSGTKINKVIGAGTTNSVNTYTVENDLYANYYRLKQVDFDGKFEYYGPIYVDCASSNNELFIHPNPNKGTFVVTINSNEELGESSVFIHDVSGKLAAVHNINLFSGTNTIQFENNNLMVGTYIVSVRGKEKNTFKPVKLVVQ
jgi:hypothetical protein